MTRCLRLELSRVDVISSGVKSSCAICPTPYFNVKVEGIVVEAMIDTGS